MATTCLTETIGDDVGAILGEFTRETPDFAARVVRVSTPSFQGNHVQGFHAAVRALADQLAREAGEVLPNRVNLFPGFVSPADLRHLGEIVRGFGLDPVILPDYSETLDGPAKAEYEPLPSGGTPVERIEKMGRSAASLELGRALAGTDTAAALLATRFRVPAVSLGLPVGLRESDRFFGALSTLAGRSIPEEHNLERGRLVDAYVDGHKYLAGRRVAVFGDEDLVIGLASFLAEIGVQPVLCATGATGERFAAEIRAVTEGLVLEPVRAESGVDFDDIARMAEEAKPDLLIGSSKGFGIARKLGIPLLRVGFPIHDRFGGQRTLHVGYRGALALYDRVVNAILQIEQERSSVGYGYL